MNALEKMRQLAREEEERKSAAGQQKPKSKGDLAYFPMGDIPDNTTTVLRFLPDGNTDNPWFWVERQVCKLQFAGQEGGEYETDELVEVTVPCMDMWIPPKNGVSACPIIQGTKYLWKDENDEAAIELARQYYKKRSYVYQGFVVNTGVEEEEKPENPIRRFIIYPSIHKLIKSVIANTDIEHSPTDYMLGRDFKIQKDRGPGAKWPSYNSSNWSMKVRPLSEEENIAIQQYNLFNLGDFVPVQPDAEGVAIIKAMFEDSIAGKPFDYASYGQFYRAFKVRGGERRDTDAVTVANAHAPKAQAKVEKPAPKAPVRAVEEDEDDTPSPTPASGKPSPLDIINRLKEKQGKNA